VQEDSVRLRKCIGQCNLGQDDVCTGCQRHIDEIYNLGVGRVQVPSSEPVERLADAGDA
jgi:hypothetical protein